MSKRLQASDQLEQIAKFCSTRRIFWRTELNEFLGDPATDSNEYMMIGANLKRMMKANLIQCCGRKHRSHQYILVDPSRIDDIKDLMRKPSSSGVAR